MSLGDKEHVETHVARMFLERTEGTSFEVDALQLGDPQKGEPDILYKDMGIEIGAVLRGTNTHIDVFERSFLSAATEQVTGRIHEAIQIRLVMQDDRDTVQHTPAPAFENYKYLPKYLDGIFVCQYKAGKVDDKVVLNQKSRMRSPVFPSNPKSREFAAFIDELVAFVNALRPSAFTEHHECNLHHSLVTEGNVVKSPTHPLNDFVSPRILDKLSKARYSGNYSTQILLLHNYSLLGNSEFTTDIHFYTHHRDDIFNLIYKYINQYGSFRFYAGIHFLDFSVFAFNSNFDVVDFNVYSQRDKSEFIDGFEEIRCDIRPGLTKNR